MNVIIDMIERFDRGDRYGYSVDKAVKYERIVVLSTTKLSEATNGLLDKINFKEYKEDPMTMVYYQKPEFQEFVISNYILRKPVTFMMYDAYGELYISNLKYINCTFENTSKSPLHELTERIVFENCEWRDE